MCRVVTIMSSIPPFTSQTLPPRLSIASGPYLSNLQNPVPVPALLPPQIQDLASIVVELAEYIWYTPDDQSSFPVRYPTATPPGRALASSGTLSTGERPSAWEVLYHLCFLMIARAGITAPELIVMLRLLYRLKASAFPSGSVFLEQPPLATASLAPCGTSDLPLVVTSTPTLLSWNLPTAILAAVFLANKLIHDNVLSIKCWATLLKIPVRELHVIEWKFSEALGWNLHVKGEEYWDWVATLAGLSARGARVSLAVERLSVYAGGRHLENVVVENQLANPIATPLPMLFSKIIVPHPSILSTSPLYPPIAPASHPRPIYYHPQFANAAAATAQLLTRRHQMKPPRPHLPSSGVAASGSYHYSTASNTPTRRPRSLHPPASCTPYPPSSIVLTPGCKLPPAPSFAFAPLISPACGCSCAWCTVPRVGANVPLQWWTGTY
ncbi:hypothetical protein DFS34DRAFT_379286 [Phlyctochytrium arcticum]|nr:hypothetical protein DFS34DRAFT_379286 [Phlyctochytrium arcticum]